MRGKITKRTVDAATASGRDSFIWDSDTPGFGLKVTAAGRKVYVLQYRSLGQLKRYTIGRHGAGWTPNGARTEALRLLAQVASGIDPAVEKRRLRDDLTVSELCKLYLEEGCAANKSSTIATDRRILDIHVKPLLGGRKVKSIIKGDIERARREVAAGKTARDEKTGFRGRSIVRGGKGASNRMLSVLSAIFEFAREGGLRDDNPARGVELYKTPKRERFLTVAEIARLGDELACAEARGENPFAIAALRLLLLTGCRKSEILTLKWSYIDRERRCFRLPDSKTGSKTVPVGAPALAVLDGLPREAENEYVLPGAKPGSHYVGLQKFWQKIRMRCGLEGVRLHDKRHSFASFGVAGGDTLFMVGKLLGHTRAATTERYAHLGDDPLQQAADRISARIAAALKPHGGSGEVVNIIKRKV
jgi:integrase